MINIALKYASETSNGIERWTEIWYANRCDTKFIGSKIVFAFWPAMPEEAIINNAIDTYMVVLFYIYNKHKKW